MADEEEQLAELLRIKKRRLAELDKQIAQLGYGAPAELRMEQRELRAEVDKGTQVIEPIVKGELSEDLLAALRSFGVSSSISNALLMIEQSIASLESKVEKLAEDLLLRAQEMYSVKQDVLAMKGDIRVVEAENKAENKAGEWGRRRNFWMFVVALVLLAVVTVAIVIIAVRTRVGT